jgi:hypothetical protein
MGILKVFGLAPNKNDERLKELVNKSYSSVRVVGRGTIKIDPKEVRQSCEFKKAQQQAKEIVKAS